MEIKTLKQLLAETDDAYLCFIHLSGGCEDAIEKIKACQNRVTDELIFDLILSEDGNR